jgi:hypothetical protein
MRAAATLASIIAIAASLAGTADAAQIGKDLQIGNWTLGAYTSRESGRFSHCAASGRYRHGVTLFFAVTRDYQWSIGFGSDQFDISAGERVKLAIALDDSNNASVEGKAIDRNLVRVVLTPSSDLFKRFMRANVLHLYATDSSYSFALQDTSRLLPQLLKCVRDQLNPAPLVAQGPSDQGSAGKPSPAASAAQSAQFAETTSLAANLLSEAGVSGFRFNTPTPSDIARGIVRWSAPSMTGTLAVMNEPSAKRGTDHMAKLIAVMAAKCKGKFASGSMPEESGAGRAFTSCQDGTGDPTVGYFLAMPRSAGGFFVLLTFPRAGASETDPDKEIRAAAARILK